MAHRRATPRRIIRLRPYGLWRDKTICAAKQSPVETFTRTTLCRGNASCVYLSRVSSWFPKTSTGTRREVFLCLRFVSDSKADSGTERGLARFLRSETKQGAWRIYSEKRNWICFDGWLDCWPDYTLCAFVPQGFHFVIHKLAILRQ